MAKARRSLLDLYSPGRDITFDDGTGDPVTVWLQKINPAEHEEAARRAGAARARLRAQLADHDSEIYLELVDDISSYERKVLVDYLVSEKEVELRLSVEAELELGDDTEWGKDGYARGLIEAWGDGLRERYITIPDDPEVRRVLDEITRFNDEVANRIEPEMEMVRNGYDDYPIERLREEVAERFIESRLNAEWTREYERSRVWRATRTIENHRQQYFTSRDEVDYLDDEIREGLIDAYREIAVGMLEGKDSPASPASSTSSETPETEAGGSGRDGASPSTTSATS